nr:NAD(P)H-dependent oxidoreductase subunit E [Methylogaea oryzae]
MHSEYIDPILERYGHNPTKLMQILRETQEHFGHIHADAIDHLAAKLGITRAQIESTATFYSFFYLEPVGRYRILFSDNITDRMLGNMDLLERLCRQLWIERGKVSEDGLVSVDTTSCTGMCDQGPALLVNNRAATRLTAERVDAIAELVKNQTPLAQWPAEFFQVEDNIRRKDKLLGSELQPGEALRAALSKPPEALVEEVKASNLRGRGGAGFTTGLKWEACRNAPGEAHYVVCNADEGEPGTFKDRVLLTSYADKVFEGMTLCGYAIGAKLGMLYLRGEYRYLLDPLNEILQRRRNANLLGSGILGKAGFDFDIEIHLAPALHLRRGVGPDRIPGRQARQPAQPPAFPRHPRLFAAADGGQQRGDFRRHHLDRPARRRLVPSHRHGKIRRHQAAVGIRRLRAARHLRIPLRRDGGPGAGRLRRAGYPAAQVSGPSGVCISSAEFGRRIAFEDIPTAGAFMVFDQSRDMFEVARNFAHFFAHESCGFCTPCRVGTSLQSNLMDKLHNGHGSPYDFEEIKKLNQLLLSMSHCGLGHTACNPVLDTIAKFPAAYEKRLQHKDFTPAFNLDWALGPARRMTGRDDSGAHFKEEATGETP